ncbi:hypothetical protein Flexsi_2227 [Flexistipes sinusarabici DSM 4947]|uniref:Uncharacterized protein n=1 Tax=Flexistipes sinusarabici (strain ATCC 49648 / DSM 4947 / MAS 10) TaxID=717231 RepID=F8E681_FLESM|nr:hypothetical protein [Flexistipes sinusarabici]AEI15848.1 hypothetical protein Flexsi_2227 [Flexistipes sinusarabici DSM 4947]
MDREKHIKSGEGEELDVLSHEPVKGYKTAFGIVFSISLIYLLIIFIVS